MEKLAERADSVMAAAGHTMSIPAIDAQSQDLKTVLMDISSRLSRQETPNGTAISTYGQRLLTLDLGLRKGFRWPFIITCIFPSSLWTANRISA
ncbi:hypothetical protein NPIL_95941 [Nephila pilipes]|uniref:Uncharacterized protein n=1 Tax=Nephila pilipes TaxID=299642 RepID=A0A8X6TSE4_NEPPI|nr:hypothetical protein NPIL_95941 [Nephila pilipes]